ncbi:hypothetical protein C0J52_15135 [Blattella germanica]|nr:hypothetical protein C0J52_15135 [Blattella germanica]
MTVSGYQPNGHWGIPEIGPVPDERQHKVHKHNNTKPCGMSFGYQSDNRSVPDSQLHETYLLPTSFTDYVQPTPPQTQAFCASVRGGLERFKSHRIHGTVYYGKHIWKPFRIPVPHNAIANDLLGDIPTPHPLYFGVAFRRRFQTTLIRTRAIFTFTSLLAKPTSFSSPHHVIFRAPTKHQSSYLDTVLVLKKGLTSVEIVPTKALEFQNGVEIMTVTEQHYWPRPLLRCVKYQGSCTHKSNAVGCRLSLPVSQAVETKLPQN